MFTTIPRRSSVRRVVAFVMMTAALFGAGGCNGSEKTWQDRFHWRAEDYFTDAKVVALCRAIETNDLAEMTRLINAGADANATGKGNMTPLLWAFYGGNTARLELLLKNGADPNVRFESDFGAKGRVPLKGASITHFACSTAYPKYFDLVFDHGGDPNLVDKTWPPRNETPLFYVIFGRADEKRSKIAKLAAMGADLNHRNEDERTPAEAAASWGFQLDLTKQLLQLGADFKSYRKGSNHQLVHALVGLERRQKEISEMQLNELHDLLDWLQERDVDIDKARADVSRWESAATPEAYRQMMSAEVAERKRQEEQAKGGANR